MKRKSLLVAMAAMSLAAIGAGSVSTLAWFQAVVSTTPQESYANVATISSVALPELTQTSESMTITFALEEDDDTADKALRLSEYGKLSGQTLTKYTASGYSETVGDVGAFQHAYISAGGSTIWNSTTALTSGADDAYGKKETGENGYVDYKIFAVTATADADYRASDEMQAGFALYEHSFSFTATERTYYWVSTDHTKANLAATPYDAPVAFNFSLEAGWNGTKTIIGYVAVAAHGDVSNADTTGVDVGFSAMAVGKKAKK